MTNITLSGKPQVGNPHVRFFKGEAASGDPTRESRLGSMGKAVLVFSLALAAAVTWAAAEGTDITADLQGRIDAAFRSGGGTVTIDRGEWRIRGIRLRSNVTLRLSAGAVVRASRDMDDFDVLSKDVVEPLNRQDIPVFICHIKPAQFLRWSRAIICIYKARNVKILGEEGAVIDGRNSYDPQGEEGFRGAHGITAVDSEGSRSGGRVTGRRCSTAAGMSASTTSRYAADTTACMCGFATGCRCGNAISGAVMTVLPGSTTRMSRSRTVG